MGYKTIGRFVYDSTAAYSVVAGDALPLTTATTTCNLSCDGGTVTISQAGVYLITANMTFEASATGAIETQLYRNGNAVSGAHAYSTADASGDYVSQEYSTIVSVPKCGQATISIKTLDDASVIVANLLVVKLA